MQHDSVNRESAKYLRDGVDINLRVAQSAYYKGISDSGHQLMLAWFHT